MQLRLSLRLAGVEGAYRRDETSVTAGSINWSGIWDRTADLITTGMGGVWVWSTLGMESTYRTEQSIASITASSSLQTRAP